MCDARQSGAEPQENFEIGVCVNEILGITLYAYVDA